MLRSASVGCKVLGEAYKLVKNRLQRLTMGATCHGWDLWSETAMPQGDRAEILHSIEPTLRPSR